MYVVYIKERRVTKRSQKEVKSKNRLENNITAPQIFPVAWNLQSSGLDRVLREVTRRNGESGSQLGLLLCAIRCFGSSRRLQETGPVAMVTIEHF